MLEDFRNEPFTDFSQAEARSAFESALARVERQRGIEIPLVIGGRRLRTGRLLENRNPADRAEVLSRHHLADRNTAAKALEVAVKAQKTWGVVAPRERASVLLRAAARRHGLSARGWSRGPARPGRGPPASPLRRSFSSNSPPARCCAGAARS